MNKAKPRFGLFVVFLIFLPFYGFATQLEPWFGQDLLVEIRPKYCYRYYPHVNVAGKNVSRHSNDHFLSLSTSFAALNWISAEIELDTAASTHTGYSFEDWKFTGRYLFLNDIEGDPISLIVGASISQVTSPGLHNISYYHHGQMEYMAHVSLGKEFSCGQFWISRIWGYLQAGIANRGSPWTDLKIAYDWNRCDLVQYGIFLKGFIGYGSHRLNLHHRFPGYGPIQYRAIDLGAYFNKVFPDWGELKLEYILRPWAYNFPTHAHSFIVTLMIPFNP